MTSYDDRADLSGPDGPQEPAGWSPLSVALLATLVLLLGLGGALFGIHAANKTAAQGATPTRLPQSITTPTSTPTGSTPTRTPTRPPTTTSPPVDGFALPNLADQGFKQARTTVRELKLGWRLQFEGAGADATVRATDPPAGTTVTKGTTIKIFVKGGAPLADVPNVKTKPCADAAAMIVDAGLYPKYLTGREGVVLSQTPTSEDLHWNDEMSISCGSAP